MIEDEPAACGPDACFTLSDAEWDRLMAVSDTPTHITRPSGEPGEDRRPTPTMDGLSGRQSRAARTLRGYWHGALPIRSFPMAYGDAGRSGGACLTKEEIKVAQDCWWSYCAGMNEIARRSSQRHADAVRCAVIYDEAVPAFHLVREGLTVFADILKLK